MSQAEVVAGHVPPDPILKVKEFLAAQKVAKVGVVDDGFDAPDSDELQAKWKEFVEQANASPALFRQLQELGIDADGDEDVTAIADMDRRIREKGGDLAEALDRTVTESPAKKMQGAGIKNLAELLEGRLALNLQKLGTDAVKHIDQLVGAQIVFLDYYLGDENPAGVAAAVSVVKKVCERCDTQRKPRPMFVLFSRSHLKPADVMRLRRRAKIPAWQFRFIHKDNLSRDTDIVLRIWELAQGLDGVRGIEKFLRGFRKTLESARAGLDKTLDDLDLADIAYLDLMKLSAERASLSQYLTWLFGAYVHNAILRDEKYQGVAEALDRVDLKELPTRHVEPTPQVLDLYRDVLYEPGYRKLGLDEDGRRSARLQLGEIYVRSRRGGKKDAVLVINNSCDLARPTADMTVGFLRGELFERHRAANLLASPKKKRSDAFGMDGKQYVIDWSLDRCENIAHRAAFGWLNKEKYRLVARMRLENALEIKQAYLARLDRIGLPIAPPMLSKLRITGVFWSDGAQKAQEIFGRSGNDAVEIFTIDTYDDKGDREQRFFFSSDFLAKLAGGLREKFREKAGDATLKKLVGWSSNYGKLTALMYPKKKGEFENLEVRMDSPLKIDDSVQSQKALIVCAEYRT